MVFVAKKVTDKQYCPLTCKCLEQTQLMREAARRVLPRFAHHAGLSIYKNMCSLAVSVPQMGQECSCSVVSDGRKQTQCMLWKRELYDEY